MFESPKLDALRTGALDRIERANNVRRWAIVAASLVEVAFLAAFFFLADFHNRTHLLLFLSVLALYWLIGLGLLALSAHHSRNIQLVLRMLEERDVGEPGG